MQLRDVRNVALVRMAPAANADWVNDFYGGKDLEGSNIVLPNGSIDPWHALSVTDASNLPPSVTTVFMTVGVVHAPSTWSPLALVCVCRKRVRVWSVGGGCWGATPHSFPLDIGTHRYLGCEHTLSDIACMLPAPCLFS